MVTIVQHIHQISVERMNVVQLWEAVNDSSELFIDGLLHKLDLSHVKLANTLDFEALADLGRRLALRLRQHNVDEVVSLRNLSDLLEVVSTLGHRLCFFGNSYCQNKSDQGVG